MRCCSAVELDPAIAKRMPHELSGGQQQRVALARALARRPKLMLLDEPFSALDAGLRTNMREMVKRRLTEEGVTGILVTHDQQEALSFADQLAVLEDGRVVQAGSPRELYLQPRTEMLAKFLGDALIIDAMVQGGETDTPLGRVRVGARDPRRRGRVMLRPEQVRLVPLSEGTPTAEIVSASFEGPITVVTFKAQGARFTLKVPSADAPLAGPGVDRADRHRARVSGLSASEISPLQVVLEVLAVELLAGGLHQQLGRRVARGLRPDLVAAPVVDLDEAAVAHVVARGGNGPFRARPRAARRSWRRACSSGSSRRRRPASARPASGRPCSCRGSKGRDTRSCGRATRSGTSFGWIVPSIRPFSISKRRMTWSG